MTAPDAAGRRAWALVVDDNIALAENVAEILGSVPGAELSIEVAASADAALERIAGREAELDLALIDVRLPDRSGVDLLAELRRRCPLVEVVLITGDATLETAIAAVQRGAFAYVVKPFRGPELIDTAARALSRVRLERDRAALRSELERSERRHRDVVEATPALVVALDAEGRIVVWNRQIEQLSGFPRGQMLGRSGREIVGDGGDRKLPLAGGGHRLVRWRLAQVGESGGTYAVGIDVSAEREMQRRTLRAERLAAVGTLAAGLAHEVRNPLNSASLQLEVLERRIQRVAGGADELLPVVRLVDDEIQRLGRLVGDFLSFAQQRTLALAAASLEEVVVPVLDLIAIEAETRGVAIVRELDTGVGRVELDVEPMRQALLNLTRNALEAMPDGGTLTVRTRRADEAGSVILEVEDTGPGVPEDAPIFDAFFTTKPGGTGLGLAIVHRVVLDHGGTLDFDSRPGRTTFRVALPQYQERGDAGAAPR
jgi:signal transduction histidine kinase